jgi:hypothetical protein
MNWRKDAGVLAGTFVLGGDNLERVGDKLAKVRVMKANVPRPDKEVGAQKACLRGLAVRGLEHDAQRFVI